MVAHRSDLLKRFICNTHGTKQFEKVGLKFEIEDWATSMKLIQVLIDGEIIAVLNFSYLIQPGFSIICPPHRITLEP